MSSNMISPQKLEMDALHCAKEHKDQDASTNKEGETNGKKEDGGTNGNGNPKLKRPQQGKIWPSSMTEEAASFKLFERNGKNDKAVSTSDQEIVVEQTTGQNNGQKEEEKSVQEKKCDWRCGRNYYSSYSIIDSFACPQQIIIQGGPKNNGTAYFR